MKKIVTIAVLVFSTNLFAAKRCHSLMGTWIEKPILDAYTYDDKCAIVSKNVQVTQDDGSEKTISVLKLDRYAIYCDGVGIKQFGEPSDTRYLDDLVYPPDYVLNKKGNLEIRGFDGPEHVKVSTEELGEILESAKECLAKYEQN